MKEYEIKYTGETKVHILGDGSGGDMPNDNSTMGERFNSKFLLRSVFGQCINDVDGKANERIIEFIQGEISRAVGEREREIAERIKTLKVIDEPAAHEAKQAILNWCFKSLITK